MFRQPTNHQEQNQEFRQLQHQLEQKQKDNVSLHPYKQLKTQNRWQKQRVLAW